MSDFHSAVRVNPLCKVSRQFDGFGFKKGLWRDDMQDSDVAFVSPHARSKNSLRVLNFPDSWNEASLWLQDLITGGKPLNSHYLDGSS